ncbi:hypothetical protein [Nocardia sp. NPDC051832]|uniref:hypothetical protein n=1 Tax=Nocardia sp. NPDC051832 TaxID=3155673 RepID=UPI0034137185
MRRVRKREPEDELLAEAMGRIDSGAKFAARFLENDIVEFDREVLRSFDLAVERVHSLLVDLGDGADPEVMAAAPDRARFRVLAKEGLIKQRAGQKTAERVAALLDAADPGPE